MAAASSNNAANGCMAIGAVVGLLLLVSMCSATKEKTTTSFSSPTLSNQVDSMSPPAAAPITPLNGASSRKGGEHLQAVIAAQGLSGAMIYSQNCYDALVRSFSWPKLDQCGGFDIAAVEAAQGVDTEGLAAELEYFGSEAAAGRYLAVATKAGQSETEADERLELLQKRMKGLSPTTPKPTPRGDNQEAPATDNSAPDDEVGQAEA